MLPSSQIYSPQTPSLLEAHYTRYALPAGSPLPAAEFAKLFAFYSYSSLHGLYTTVYGIKTNLFFQQIRGYRSLKRTEFKIIKISTMNQIQF